MASTELQLSCFSDESATKLPIFNSSPKDVEVTEGEEAVFECSITPCLPLPGISWYKDDSLIPADDEDFKQTFDGRLAILCISGTYLDDAGVYTCVIIHSSGETRVSAKLTVNGKSVVG